MPISTGEFLVQAGRLDEAVEQYRTALDLKPNAAELHSNLGHVLGLLGQGQQAKAEFEEAVRLNPDFAEAHVNLATCWPRTSRRRRSSITRRRSCQSRFRRGAATSGHY